MSACFVQADMVFLWIRCYPEPWAEEGTNGFGYDPIFMYGDRSFAELSAEEKDSVSHRADALRKFEKRIKGE